MYKSAYYFRAHTYTMVPRQVREDLQWMADHATQGVVLGILEQDLFAAVENIDLICNEAEKLGLHVWATPSRWGGLVAGCPKVPSIFAAKNPHAWMKNRDGSPVMGIAGPLLSVFHPESFAFFRESLERMFALWPIRGVIWDELKALECGDYSERALAALGEEQVGRREVQVREQAAFFGRCNRAVKELNPGGTTSCFVYGHYAREPWLGDLVAMPDLDEFGLDGRPWGREDAGTSDTKGEEPTKFLLTQGPVFREAARARGKKSLVLIENHALSARDNQLMRSRLDRVFALEPDHLLYYYYPRSCEAPEEAMAILGEGLLSRS